MLKVYKVPQVLDQDQNGSGDILFGIQDGQSVAPLPFYITGNNTAIASFTAVKYDLLKNELERISMDTSIISIDVPNSIYNVDGLSGYDNILENGLYNLEFQNGTDLYKTEYFKVTDYSPVWILATGFWNDGGVWDDTAFWID